MRYLRWTILLLATGLLLAACRPGETFSISDPAPVLAVAQPQGSLSAQAVPAGEAPAEEPPAEPNECLNCHGDQQRIIDTLKPEEPQVEGESSGVG